MSDATQIHAETAALNAVIRRIRARHDRGAMRLAELRERAAEPRPPSPAMLRAFAAIERGARETAHAGIVRAVRAMLADRREFNRVEPGLADMLAAERAEHCRDLWRACRAERRRLGDPILGRTDATNLRAAYVAAWIVERRERREAMVREAA